MLFSFFVISHCHCFSCLLLLYYSVIVIVVASLACTLPQRAAWKSRPSWSGARFSGQGHLLVLLLVHHLVTLFRKR